MNHTDLIKELRALTSAGMSDCKAALTEANWDLQAAIDLIKIKGLNIADARSSKVASEGLVSILGDFCKKFMVEVNTQTDFVSQSPDFQEFVELVIEELAEAGESFQYDCTSLETARKNLISKTKENIVVRRWWIEEAMDSNVRVFSYVHSNNKIGVLLTLQAPSQLWVDHPSFQALGENLAMQVAAMNPLAVSSDRINSEDLERQKNIFQTQLKELNKPEASWPKIMEGKMSKWHKEVCLLEQEAVWLPKTTVKQAVQNVSSALGGEVQIINFIRCQVGEGIETKKDDLAEEVAKLM